MKNGYQKDIHSLFVEVLRLIKKKYKFIKSGLSIF